MEDTLPREVYTNGNRFSYSADGMKVYYIDVYRDTIYLFSYSRNDTAWLDKDSIRIDHVIDTDNETVIQTFVTNSGNLYYSIYLSSNYTLDIYSCPFEDGAFGKPERIFRNGSWSFTISPDEKYLLFEKSSSGYKGTTSLFLSYRKEDGTWSDLRYAGDGITHYGGNVYPSFSPDGKYLFITYLTGYPLQYSQIHWVSTSFIDDLTINPIPYLTDRELIKVYPNPAEHHLFIECQTGKELLKYELVNFHGQTILSGYLAGNSIDVSAIESGIYILRLDIDGELINVKILKK
ncbi:MAG: T9SS type A sorting domain-containing protein [Bacteroidales bacterium]|jgi:hypothetical protein